MRKFLIVAILFLSVVFLQSFSFAIDLQNVEKSTPTPYPYPSSQNDFLIKPRIVNPKGRADDFGSGGQTHMVGIINSETFLRGQPNFLESDLNIFQNQFCAGTLITNTWVLTAAHCVDNNETYATTDPDNIEVISGYPEIDLDNLDYTDAVSVDSIVIHPDFDRLDSGTLVNDLALLKLSSPMAVQTSVFDFGLPINPSDALEIYGWGVSSYASNQFNPPTDSTLVVPSVLYLDVRENFTWPDGAGINTSTFASSTNGLLSTIDPLFRVETSSVRSYTQDSLPEEYRDPNRRWRQTYAPIRYDFSFSVNCESIGEARLVTENEYFDGEEWIQYPDYGFLNFFTARIKNGSSYNYSFFDWTPGPDGLAAMPNNSCGNTVTDLNKSIDDFITENTSFNGVSPIEEQSESAMLMADVNAVDCDDQELDSELEGKVICIDKTDINNADTCQGDSGGPLYRKQNNRLFLVGITSFGSYPCDDGNQSVFTSVNRYRSWIASFLPNPGTIRISNTNLSSQAKNNVRLSSSMSGRLAEPIYETNSTGCSIIGDDSLTVDRITTCSVVARLAANGIYTGIKSSPVTFTFTISTQATLNISNTPKTNLPAGTRVTLTSSGGSGAGVVTYSTSTSACSITAGVLNVTSPRTCVVTATKAANGIYSSATATTNFIFVSVPQATLRITNTNRNNPKVSQVTITTSGGSGSGSIAFSVTGPGCQIVSGNKVTTNNVTRCLVTAFKGASGIYGNVRSTPPTTFTFY